MFDSHKPEDVQVGMDKAKAAQIEAARKNMSDNASSTPEVPIPEAPAPVVNPVAEPPQRPRNFVQATRVPRDPKAEQFFRKAQIFKNMEEDFAWQDEQDRKKYQEAQDRKKAQSKE